jgi:hypothetical protein
MSGKSSQAHTFLSMENSYETHLPLQGQRTGGGLHCRPVHLIHFLTDLGFLFLLDFTFSLQLVFITIINIVSKIMCSLKQFPSDQGNLEVSTHNLDPLSIFLMSFSQYLLCV